MLISLTATYHNTVASLAYSFPSVADISTHQIPEPRIDETLRKFIALFLPSRPDYADPFWIFRFGVYRISDVVVACQILCGNPFGSGKLAIPSACRVVPFLVSLADIERMIRSTDNILEAHSAHFQERSIITGSNGKHSLILVRMSKHSVECHYLLYRYKTAFRMY